ncbi:chromosome segregation protein SMC [Bdellovibrio bacteriovorus]|uniref:Chromosome partition protein Smc n=1 Tax=Bdellovibrio bacteriovorus (strain ATCC 15356 / DSM 50701 / NCIMB 9529 / HD100) TaxID=264462 RepID=Q6MNS9_BDEBA|nr:chromosome segregation protein SMC [Bdellovibrio bacteriovorus]AHZ86382.1 chromosome segregation protein SMC [Bdellovibrio bacteriovorus]BEV67622.1 Chromosome partition protein Smc [Bdellovibrio bacteriovorus]CAE79072.1 chromosome segregation SMC protein [Bdellovibrio bacteriovorus HD100]
MRIKKIELIGFKSFKDRTVIHFDAGITGIVGPNGCGKSNIVDALMWVMGDQSAKDLRASQMTDVIFGGAEGYAPLGMCEVSLTLENDGGPFPAKYIKHSEIMVTRRLHRNGEGEYFINKEPARLKDLQEIFMDTGAGSKGFSIIAQGMIGKIITAKPEDRRMLIEEAAGITKFKARKKESQRKLVATDQNLVRLQDIIGELKRQIDSLQRQAQRAERYRNIKNQIEDLDLWLSTAQYVELKRAADEAQAIFNEAQSMEVEGETNLSTLQGQLEVLKLQILEKEKAVEEQQTEYFTKQSTVQKKEMEIQELRFEIEQARRNEQMTGTILQEQQARKELLARDKAALDEQVTELKEESESLSAAFAEKNEIFQNFNSRIGTVDEDLTTKRRELFAVGQTESSLDARVNSLSSQIADLTDRQDNEQQVLNELREKQVEFENRRKKVITELDKERQMQLDLASDVDSFEANKKILQDSVATKKAEVDSFKDSLNEVASRLYGLENLQNNFEGFQEGVKQVMLWQKTRTQEMMADGSVVSHFQPVSEVVEVPAEYEVAMEAALGSRLQMLLSSDANIAVDAVSHLKENKSGRSSFMAADGQGLTFNRAEAPMGQDGVQAILKDVVQAADKFKNTVTYMLDGVAIVDSIRTALNLRPRYEGWTFVTLDGDTLTADGVLTGGSSESADSGMLKRRREIKELSEKKDEFAGKLQLAQMALKKTEEQLANVLNDFEGAQKRKIDQEIKVAELRKDAERAENEVQNALAAVERQEREVKKLTEQLEVQEQKLEELNEALIEARERKVLLETEVETLNSEMNSVRLGFDGLQAEVTDLQVKSASKTQEYTGVLRQLEMVTKSLTDLEAQLARMSEEAEGYNSQMTDTQVTLEEKKIEFERLLDEVETLKLQAARAKDEYEVMSESIRAIEDEASASQRARNERQHKMNDSQLKLEQAKMKEQYLIDQVRERYMLNLPDVVEKYVNREGDFLEADAQLKDLREKLAKIGEVNLSAIEEYEETAQRYEFLTKQHADLTEAKDQLRKVIERINKICSKRFKETFELVNDRFTRVFPVLFGGGEAWLELVEETEKNEAGIEIIARPPGKKTQNVSLMSGGEKALTAVALVFSIFLVKPSPWCLLDEVDAPLDDANVFRFNDLVREMAKRSQIIVVTHNKHTMEVAGKLYGVTMQERGVSTMVSVSIQDIK